MHPGVYIPQQVRQRTGIIFRKTSDATVSFQLNFGRMGFIIRDEHWDPEAEALSQTETNISRRDRANGIRVHIAKFLRFADRPEKVDPFGAPQPGSKCSQRFEFFALSNDLESRTFHASQGEGSDQKVDFLLLD
ncbi:hypothetical protein ASF72_06880 [Arthrobacter sp. Leaf141]|nr:hypothetical protein ASF72_06880 [Arthrobacter sp. Leaf141]